MKQEDLDLDLDHVGTEFFSFSEEEGTETPVDERVRAEEYIKAHAPPVPTGPFPREYMTYLFPVWKYPTHPHGWKYGLEAAIKHVTSSQQRWKKCLADSVEHLAKKGLPPTDTAKCNRPEIQVAEDRPGVWLLVRLAERQHEALAANDKCGLATHHNDSSRESRA